MQAAYDQGTLVLLQNLDPAYTSSQVEVSPLHNLEYFVIIIEIQLVYSQKKNISIWVDVSGKTETNFYIGGKVNEWFGTFVDFTVTNNFALKFYFG